jgi:hypothetical protein
MTTLALSGNADILHSSFSSENEIGAWGSTLHASGAGQFADTLDIGNACGPQAGKEILVSHPLRAPLAHTTDCRS